MVDIVLIIALWLIVFFWKFFTKKEFNFAWLRNLFLLVSVSILAYFLIATLVNLR